MQSQALNWLSILRDVSRRCNEYLYKTIMRLVLEYCNYVWDPHQDKYILGLVGFQIFAARLIARQWCAGSDLLWNVLHWPPLCSSLVPQIMTVQTDPLWTITNFIILLYSSPLSDYVRHANSCPLFQSYIKTYSQRHSFF